MHNYPPGFNPRRLVKLMQDAIQRCELQLHGLSVLTEAATGVYAITPVVAAMAGAQKVFAIARNSRYGTIEQAVEQTKHLAKLAGVSDTIEFITDKSKDIVGQADIITNSGHVRPIDAEMIGWMKPTAIIPLMYEAWEFRPEDVDLAACRHRGIRVAGINERHPFADVFSFLGVMAIKLLHDAGIAVYGSNILLLCDNPFQPYIERVLENVGAHVDSAPNLLEAPKDKMYDAILVSLQPHIEPVVSAQDVAMIAKYWPGAIIAQYWGDIDRESCSSYNIPVWPEAAPKPGHMGILPSGVGPEATIRLQTAGLKIGEVLLQPSLQPNSPGMELVQLL